VENQGQPSACRTPDENDLVRLCRELNAHGVRYVVVGGFAIVQHGFPRATEDIDLLLDPSLENQARVKKALLYLPDQAVRELGDEDLTKYVVARVADEVLVDLMFFACGIGYEEASKEIEIHQVQGVPIPFASPALLLRMKQTVRDKDELDREWLRQKLGMPPKEKPAPDAIPWRKVGWLMLAAAITGGALAVGGYLLFEPRHHERQPPSTNAPVISPP
jgi:hypothetical protein